MTKTSQERRWPAGTLMDRLSEPMRQGLLDLAPPRSVKAGTVLLSQGDHSTHVYLLEAVARRQTACVKVTSSLSNGVEILLGIRVTGDLVGELAALRSSERSASVTTCTPTTVHAIPQEVFMSYLNQQVETWVAVSRMIADRLDWANRRRLDFAAYEVPLRLARVMIDLFARHGQTDSGGLTLGVELSQPEMGRLIGAREDATRRAVRTLRTAKLIDWSYRRVTILDLAGLRTFAEIE